jgi:hypothetical protein
MHSARTAGLRPRAKTKLLQQRLYFQGNAAYVLPCDARAGIKIDAQLIRMIQIARAYRMGM